jgi:catechol 2,3-dioxygenase-like lactoylglutathione lyase family enzyme
MRNPSRTSRLPQLLAAVLGTVMLHAAQAAGPHIERLSSTVSDLSKSVAFYERGLSFELVRYEDRAGEDFARLSGVPGAKARAAVLRLGTAEIELVQYTSGTGRKIPADSKSPDLWFQHFAIIVSDMKKAHAQLAKLHPLGISAKGPQQLPPSTGNVQAFKFKDPDGHPLELLYFPAGAGRPMWHEPSSDRIFLGIDHTAIGISDTGATKAFYTDLLGIPMAYESLNSGPTQERLDGTLGAVVRITGILPPSGGIGIEFLDYRTPPTGRIAPVDTVGNDLSHMHVVLRVEALDALAKTLADHKVPFVSPGPQPLPGGLRGLQVRDPDRHVVQLIGQ